MNRDDKKRADRFLQNRGQDDFSREEYRSIEDKLFGTPETKTRRKFWPTNPFGFPGWQPRYFALAGSLATVMIVAISTIILYTGDLAGPARFAERGGPVFETYAIRQTDDGEPSIRSVQGIEIVSIDELLQFRVPAQSGCTSAAFFGVDENFNRHFYFPSQPGGYGFALQSRGDTYSPGSIRLASGHNPGYLRIFFVCVANDTDLATLIDEIERVESDTNGDFNALTDLDATDIEFSSQLIKLKNLGQQ